MGDAPGRGEPLSTGAAWSKCCSRPRNITFLLMVNFRPLFWINVLKNACIDFTHKTNEIISILRLSKKCPFNFDGNIPSRLKTKTKNTLPTPSLGPPFVTLLDPSGMFQQISTESSGNIPKQCPPLEKWIKSGPPSLRAGFPLGGVPWLPLCGLQYYIILYYIILYYTISYQNR